MTIVEDFYERDELSLAGRSGYTLYKQINKGMTIVEDFTRKKTSFH
jgi:hypothetical protein